MGVRCKTTATIDVALAENPNHMATSLVALSWQWLSGFSVSVQHVEKETKTKARKV